MHTCHYHWYLIATGDSSTTEITKRRNLSSEATSDTKERINPKRKPITGDQVTIVNMTHSLTGYSAASPVQGRAISSSPMGRTFLVLAKFTAAAL